MSQPLRYHGGTLVLENTTPGAVVSAPFRWVKGKPRRTANHYVSLIPWPKRVMEQIMEYNILDFSEWQDNVKSEGDVPQVD